MRRGTGLAAVEGPAWADLLAALDEAVRRNRGKALAALAARDALPVDEARRELAALPTAACAAVDEAVGIAAARCTAGAGCPVAAECPLVRGGGVQALAASATARFIGAFITARAAALPPAPVAQLAALPADVAALLATSGRVPPGAPPRARTSLALLDLALARGGPCGASGPFLRAVEVEQVAAFIPPAAGRGDARLAALEAWLRQAALAEVALVERR